MNDLHVKILGLETKVENLEGEVKTLKSKNEELESILEMKEIEETVFNFLKIYLEHIAYIIYIISYMIKVNEYSSHYHQNTYWMALSNF